MMYSFGAASISPVNAGDTKPNATASRPVKIAAV
jgi:hypothetical protein